jgi:hypothetical protein
MRAWWNGRHKRLKISRPVRAGSTPAARTKKLNNDMPTYRIKFTKTIELDFEASSESEALMQAGQVSLDQIPVDWEMNFESKPTDEEIFNSQPAVVVDEYAGLDPTLFDIPG